MTILSFLAPLIAIFASAFFLTGVAAHSEFGDIHGRTTTTNNDINNNFISTHTSSSLGRKRLLYKHPTRFVSEQHLGQELETIPSMFDDLEIMDMERELMSGGSSMSMSFGDRDGDGVPSTMPSGAPSTFPSGFPSGEPSQMPSAVTAAPTDSLEPSNTPAPTPLTEFPSGGPSQMPTGASNNNSGGGGGSTSVPSTAVQSRSGNGTNNGNGNTINNKGDNALVNSSEPKDTEQPQQSSWTIVTAVAMSAGCVIAALVVVHTRRRRRHCNHRATLGIKNQDTTDLYQDESLAPPSLMGMSSLVSVERGDDGSLMNAATVVVGASDNGHGATSAACMA